MIKFIFLIILSSFTFLFSANQLELEEQLHNKLSALLTARQQLANSQEELTACTKKIESQNEAQKQDQKQLAQWYEEIRQITDKINTQEAIIESLQEDIHSLNEELDLIYKAKIDSLKKAAQNQTQSREKEKIEELIKQITEKRLTILLPFQNITFNPQKVNKIELDQVSDSIEYQIQVEYLSSAKDETANLLASVVMMKSEMNDIYTLQQRTQRFLEDIDVNRSSPFYTQLPADNKTTFGTGNRTENNDIQYNAIQVQANSLVDILTQLGRSHQYYIKEYQDLLQKSQQLSSSTEEYIKLLDDAENLLRDYLQLIESKIGENH